MPREMIVVPYRSEWKSLYEAEKSRIARVMGDSLVAIHHIGSTAVAGLAAKPVIDILVVVEDLQVIDDHAGQLEHLGYEGKGEFGIKGRRFFRKGGDENPTHHVHVFGRGDRNIHRYIAFREYLRKFARIRDEYGALKLRGSQIHRFDTEGYMEHKDQYVRETEAHALEWYEKAVAQGNAVGRD